MGEFAFEKGGEYARDIFKYDYESAMHYDKASFLKSGVVTLQALTGIGATGYKKQLSQTDIAAVHFMYNDCNWNNWPQAYRWGGPKPKPRCVSNFEDSDGGVPSVSAQVGREFEVEFNAVFYAQMTFTFDVKQGRSSPTGSTSSTPANAATLEQIGITRVKFTPAQRDVGKTFRISANFKGVGWSGYGDSTCNVDVNVHQTVQGPTFESHATIAKKCDDSGTYKPKSCLDWLDQGFCAETSNWRQFMTDHCCASCKSGQSLAA